MLRDFYFPMELVWEFYLTRLNLYRINPNGAVVKKTRMIVISYYNIQN